MDLQQISTDNLVKELLHRHDLVTKDGVISSVHLFHLVRKLVPSMCIDGIPVRRRHEDGEIEALAIIRGTGKERGKLLSIGGRLRRLPKGQPPESIIDCLRRQVRTDIGCEINLLSNPRQPFDVAEFAPREDGVLFPDGFNYEYEQHAISLFFIVELVGEPTKLGSTPHGGQEALGVKWFTMKNLPPPNEFAYGSYRQYEKLLQDPEAYIHI